MRLAPGAPSEWQRLKSIQAKDKMPKTEATVTQGKCVSRSIVSDSLCPCGL